jgi:hypothetical protein
MTTALYLYIQECRDSKEWCPTAEQRVAVYHKLTVYMKEHFGSDEKGMIRLAQCSTTTTTLLPCAEKQCRAPYIAVVISQACTLDS